MGQAAPSILRWIAPGCLPLLSSSSSNYRRCRFSFVPPHSADFCDDIHRFPSRDSAPPATWRH